MYRDTKIKPVLVSEIYENDSAEAVLVVDYPSFEEFTARFPLPQGKELDDMPEFEDWYNLFSETYDLNLPDLDQEGEVFQAEMDYQLLLMNEFQFSIFRQFQQCSALAFQ